MLNFNSERVKIGMVVLIVLFVLISTISLLIKQIDRFDLKSIGRDRITINEKRFEGLKRILPPHTVIGYISDEKGNTKEGVERFLLTRLIPVNVDYTAYGQAKEALERFRLTQYALSPVIVDYSTKHQFVVGNFTNAATKDEIYKTNDLFPIYDSGNGVILLRSGMK